MQVHNLTQGSPEWLAYRAQHFNASDAPAMLGCSPYKTRSELLREMHTGLAPEVDAATQRLFDNGHRFEALARPLAQEIIGEDLYPVTGSKGKLSASFDGLTMDESTGFEHKMLNETLRAAFDDIETVAPEHREAKAGSLLPKVYRVQMEQQLAVSDAGRILFMATRWEGDELVEERHCWYFSDPALRAEILAGWDQFAADLAAYVPEVIEAKPIGRTPETLPALHIEVTGMVTASNLEAFREHALAVFKGINRDLTTDADFADAEKTVKWCADVEKRLEAAKDHALSQTATIDELFRTVDDIKAEARRVRLELDKLVTARKESIRIEISEAGRQAFQDHLRSLTRRLGGNLTPNVPADFITCCRSKRTVASLRDAVDTELARAKIAANELADRMEANIKTLHGEAHDWSFLFPDLGAVASKPAEDFANLLAARIAAHKQAEERRKAREAEAAAKAAQAVEKAAAPAVAQVQAALSDAIDTGTGIVRVSAGAMERIAPETVRDNDATIKLGDINARLAPIQISQDGLESLGFRPVNIIKNARLYHEADFPLICAAIAKHVMAAS